MDSEKESVPVEEGVEEDPRSMFCCLCKTGFFVSGETGASCLPPCRSLGETTSSVNCSNRPYGTDGDRETTRTRVLRCCRGRWVIIMAALKPGSVWDTPQVYKHHEQQSACLTRPKYREGRRLKAVKVYTINLESRFLLVQGVPAVGVMTELVQLFALYGVVEEYRVLDEYPAEQFTEVYLIKFQKLTSARAAKRKTDERSFYGGLLHVCYAPEHETVEDTRRKLQDRRRYVYRNTQRLEREREQEQATEKTTPASSETPAPSSVYEDRTCPRSSQEDNCSSSTSSSFPLLPLPPHERVHQHYVSSKDSFKSVKTVHEGSVPTEDRMGSLHNFIPSNRAPDDCKQTTQWSDLPSGSTFGNEERSIIKKPKHPPSTAPRFIPRTAQLENRKRKMEDSTDLLGVADRNAPLYGPKLPELPKMDMEDASLNKTANIIRQTMSKVASVPSEKKTTAVKARRRI
uniref:RNA-binding protein 48 n=1 Tax=Astyanax mexicanus TaxID=7994 RepID=A0A3B1J9Z2_ASTMX